LIFTARFERFRVPAGGRRSDKKTMTLKVGDIFTVQKEVTDELVRRFADVSGDYNPIHLDEEFAAKTRFGKRIAHGMLGASFISAVLGYKLSDRKVVYLSQSLKFVAPVFIGDTVTAKAVVKDIREDKPIVTIETTCENQAGETVITGEAKIMVLP
jgi:acyl dehydratase